MGKIIRLGLSAVFFFVVAACGGGGGGGGGSSSSGGFTISPSSLSFTAKQNDVIPARQIVRFTITASDVAFVGADLSAAASWVSAVFLSATTTSAELAVWVNTTNLSAGNYSTTFPVGIARADQSVIATATVTVQYTVTNKISASPGALTFTHVVGSPAAPAPSLTFSDNGMRSYSWSTAVSYQNDKDWLTLSQTSGASLPSTITVNVDHGLAPGTYRATITVSGDSDSVSIPVTYTVRVPGLIPAQANVSFNARNGQAAPPAEVQVSVATDNGDAVGYAIDTTYGPGATGWLNATGGTAPGMITIVPNKVDLAPATYTATVTLTPSNGAPIRTINVSYLVQASTLSASQPSASFTASNGQATPPAAVLVTMSTQPGDTLTYATSINYGSGPSNWLTTTGSIAPGTLSIVPSVTNLNVGTHTATVRLTPNTGAPVVNIAVTYIVTPSVLTLDPSSITFTLDTSSTAVPAQLQRAVTTGVSGSGLTWTVSVSGAWLAVGPGSGSAGGSVSVGLREDEVEKLDAGTAAGSVTFTYTRPNGTSGTTVLPVTLNLRLPRVSYVSPYTAASNTSKEVILRGTGFSSTGGNPIMFGNTAVSTYTVVSDTEIRVMHPSLSAGTYQVRIPNLLGMERTRANLVVVDTPAYNYAVLPAAGPADRVVHDAERRAIYLNVFDRLQRYRLIAGTWTADSLSIASLRDIALTPDGREIIAVSINTLYHIDPDTLTVLDTRPLSAAVGTFGGQNFENIAIGNDGTALVFIGNQWGAVNRYNLRTRTFTDANFSFQIYGARPLSSADGSRILIRGIGLSSTQNLWYYDVSVGQFVNTGVAATGIYASYDRTASNLLMDREAYNRNFSSLGSMAGLAASVISPDGARGYGFVAGSPGGTLRTYDLTSPNGSGGFTEIGSGTGIPDSPGIVFISGPLVGITSDGGAVIITGHQNFIIQPTP